MIFHLTLVVLLNIETKAFVVEVSVVLHFTSQTPNNRQWLILGVFDSLYGTGIWYKLPNLEVVLIFRIHILLLFEFRSMLSI